MRSSRVCGWDLAEWFERLAVNANVATVLGSIPASSDKVESEGMKQCWITYINTKIPIKSPFENTTSHKSFWFVYLQVDEGVRAPAVRLWLTYGQQQVIEMIPFRILDFRFSHPIKIQENSRHYFIKSFKKFFSASAGLTWSRPGGAAERRVRWSVSTQSAPG